LFFKKTNQLTLPLGPLFEEELVLLVLYELLCKLGDDSAVVSNAAYCALQAISHAGGHRSDSDLTPLLAANADRLADTLCYRLGHLARYPETPRVLEAIMSHTGVAMVPFIQDTLRSILDCIDEYSTTSLEPLMKVMLCVAIGMRQSSAKLNNQQPATQSEDPNREEEDPEEEPTDRDEEDDEDESPDAVTLVCDGILEKCGHFMTTRDLGVTLTAMDIAENAAACLEHRQRQLLPHLHILWPRIMWWIKDHPGISNSKSPSIIRGLEVLGMFASWSGDFLAQRFVEQVLPVLRQCLSTSAEWPAAYTFRFKLQLTVLKVLTQIASIERFLDDNVHEIALKLLPFLSDSCPEELQSAALDLFQQLILRDPDAVWMMLIQVSRSSVQTLMAASLPSTFVHYEDKDIHQSSTTCDTDICAKAKMLLTLF